MLTAILTVKGRRGREMEESAGSIKGWKGNERVLMGKESCGGVYDEICGFLLYYKGVN